MRRLEGERRNSNERERGVSAEKGAKRASISFAADLVGWGDLAQPN